MAPMKQLADLNLAALATKIGAVFSDQLGGEFEVTVQRYEQIGEGLGKSLSLNLTIHDASKTERWLETDAGRSWLALDDRLPPITAENFVCGRSEQ